MKLRSDNPGYVRLPPSRPESRPRFLTPERSGSRVELRAEAKTELTAAWPSRSEEGREASQRRWMRFNGAPSEAAQLRRAFGGEPAPQRAAGFGPPSGPPVSANAARQAGFSAPQLQPGESQDQYFHRFAAALSEWANRHAEQLGLTPGRPGGGAPDPLTSRPSGPGHRRSFTLFDPLRAS